MIRRYDTVDGRNPAPVSRYCTLSHYLQGFCTSQLVQDFFHQQYLFITESWNNIFVSAFFGRYAKLIESNFYQLQIDFRWFSWNINLWSVCVPFICWLCIQCIYTYIYIHMYLCIYIYVCIYIYFSEFCDVLFQRCFRSNACLLGGHMFFSAEIFPNTLIIDISLRNFSTQKKTHQKFHAASKNWYPEILAHCVDLHCGLWHHCLGGSLWDS